MLAAGTDMMPLVWLAAGLVWLGCAVAGGDMAVNRGIGRAQGVAIGAVLGILGLVILAFIPTRTGSGDAEKTRGTAPDPDEIPWM